eukprot:TRINITY_DN31552_c1_g1_i1.p1 TRINITY_DN31552_c1_g1~~TRINITY_DN31552_c1_g1_i1.p1  ORF type:complete len:333 (+),score=67.01 TRINITY_DN31552_c1_g1_i1:69-1001(+)
MRAAALLALAAAAAGPPRVGAFRRGQRVKACDHPEAPVATEPVALVTMITGERTQRGARYTTGAIKVLASWWKRCSAAFTPVLLMQREKPLLGGQLTMLKAAGWRPCAVKRLAPPDPKKTMPRFQDQYTKLHLWRFVEFERLVYVDSDTFVVRDPAALFSLKLTPEVRIAAARDYMAPWGWQKTFNMGVFVIRPSTEEFDRIMQYYSGKRPLKWPQAWSEQGFLNTLYRGQWHNIGVDYNANQVFWKEAPNIWREHLKTIRIVHFTMQKPWACTERDTPVFWPLCKVWVDFNATAALLAPSRAAVLQRRG